jgi:hypothetical protein
MHCTHCVHVVGGLKASSSCFVSQGRDQRLCLWDLAEGRNAVVDSVHLESVGFCRSSVLADGQLHWTLAVPGKGTDEVRTSPSEAPCSMSCWHWAFLK